MQRLLSLGLHDGDTNGSGYLELEVGIDGDGHKLDITWPIQDDVVMPREFDHLNGERFSAVVARVFEGDRQSNLPERDKLLAQDHSIERV
jgi:hypothetical protein